MSDTPSQIEQTETLKTLRWLGWGAIALAGIAVALWSRFGSAVFLDTLASAWAYCF